MWWTGLGASFWREQARVGLGRRFRRYSTSNMEYVAAEARRSAGWGKVNARWASAGPQLPRLPRGVIRVGQGRKTAPSSSPST